MIWQENILNRVSPVCTRIHLKGQLHNINRFIKYNVCTCAADIKNYLLKTAYDVKIITDFYRFFAQPMRGNVDTAEENRYKNTKKI